MGSAGRTVDRPDLTGFAEVAAGAQLVPDPVVGPLGSVHETVTVEQNEWYLDAIGEPLALYRDNAWAHPGMLIKAVHRLLTRNVGLGPWIHTASDCRLLGVAPLPARMTSHGRVTSVGRRGRNDEVRYDALVLADGGRSRTCTTPRSTGSPSRADLRRPLSWVAVAPSPSRGRGRGRRPRRRRSGMPRGHARPARRPSAPKGRSG